jgi:hypothetical protein
MGWRWDTAGRAICRAAQQRADVPLEAMRGPIYRLDILLPLVDNTQEEEEVREQTAMSDKPQPDEIPFPGRPPPSPPAPDFPEIPRPQEPLTPYPVHSEPAPTPEPSTKPGPQPPSPSTDPRATAPESQDP